MPQELLRHIKSYETVESVQNDTSVSTVVSEISNATLSSCDTLLQLIERNQYIIFDKATYVFSLVFT